MIKENPRILAAQNQQNNKNIQPRPENNIHIFISRRVYLVCLTCARLTCFERDTRLCREQVKCKNYLRDQRTKDWENERRPGKNTIQNIAKTTRKRKENMIYKTWSNWWETVPSHLAVFENPLSTSCILSAKSRVCDGLRWKPSAISGRFISIWPDKTNALYFSTVAFQWLTNQCHNKTLFTWSGGAWGTLV